MDYKVVSQQVVDNVGGLENIEGATHCVTRLRLVLKDTSKYNKAELENMMASRACCTTAASS